MCIIPSYKINDWNDMVLTFFLPTMITGRESLVGVTA